MTDRITPEEEAAKEAVIEAADGFAELADAILNRGNEDDISFLCESLQYSVLSNATKALRASRKPKGVKPETVPFGTHFRFIGLTDNKLQTTVFKVMSDRRDDGQRYIVADGSGINIHLFTESDRIIPI